MLITFFSEYFTFIHIYLNIPNIKYQNIILRDAVTFKITKSTLLCAFLYSLLTVVNASSTTMHCISFGFIVAYASAIYSGC